MKAESNTERMNPMKDTVVLYSSRYGSTKRYAEAIAARLHCLALDTKKGKEALSDYETIIFGGGIYASGIRGVSLLTKNFQKLRDKRLFVFTVGISDPTDPSRFSPMLEKIFSPEMRKQIRFFHFRGGMDYSKMSFLHRTMMKMLKSMIEKKPLSERTDEDEGILSTFGGKVDFFDENAISPLVEAVEEGSL